MRGIAARQLREPGSRSSYAARQLDDRAAGSPGSFTRGMAACGKHVGEAEQLSTRVASLGAAKHRGEKHAAGQGRESLPLEQPELTLWNQYNEGSCE